MSRNFLLFIMLLSIPITTCSAQSFKTSDILQRDDDNSKQGHLNIFQDSQLDSMIHRHILRNKNQAEKIGYYGIKGFRIQIYSGLNINARTESENIEIEFNSQFPDIISYRIFTEPVWYKVRVGNFRSRTEALKLYLIISKKFPESDLVPDIINIDDL
ncbi:MAG: SPOR domain-containing protein [Methanococcaceae archaeon]